MEQEALDARIAAQRPGHPCTLIYTSGTTGNPKVSLLYAWGSLRVSIWLQAVMVTHDNCTWTAKVVIDWINATGVTFG